MFFVYFNNSFRYNKINICKEVYFILSTQLKTDWANEPNAESAIKWLQNIHPELRAFPKKIEVRGYGVYVGKPENKQWFDIHVEYQTTSSIEKHGIYGFLHAPAEPLVSWGIIENIEDIQGAEEWFNSETGRLLMGYLLHEIYYI